MIEVPPFMCSCTSIPLTMKPLEDSRWPLMDRLPGFSIARWIDASGDARHDDRAWQQGRNRRHARLNRQQIGVASSIQRQRGHLRARYDFAEMGRNGFDLHSGTAVTITESVWPPIARATSTRMAESVSTVRLVFRCGVNPAAVMVRS